jgi:PleD family two-component response regulator
VKVTISSGVAEFPTHGRTRDELVAAADAALYASKETGRNRVSPASAVVVRKTTA